MASSIGKNIKLSVFGQSHSAAIGMVLEGIPAGCNIDMDRIAQFMARRAPGLDPWSTPRREPDAPEFLSGFVDSTTCGAPIAGIIRNTDANPSAYASVKEVFRPGHADFTAQAKFGGHQDVSGGGHFSGRLTAPICLAGAICLQLLEKEGVHIGAHAASIAGIEDARFDPLAVSVQDFERAAANRIPVLNSQQGERMAQAIAEARSAGDSVGGVIECAAIGMPAGAGSPMFDGIENVIARIMFGIPAVKGIEFGAGFSAASAKGSENNDAFKPGSEGPDFETNNAGGILGGISTGAPIVFRVAVKPTPSIAAPQRSITVDGESATCSVTGRHDPCIVPRAVPVVEAACAIALYDLLLDSRLDRR